MDSNLGTLEADDRVGIALATSFAKLALADVKGSQASYVEAQQLWVDTQVPGAPRDPYMNGASCISQIVSVYNSLEEVCHLETPLGAFALTLKAYVQSMKGKGGPIKGCLDDALQNSMEACRIHRAVGTLATPYGADSLSVLAHIQANLAQEAAASVSRAEAQCIRKSCGLEDGCTLMNYEIESAGNIDIERYCGWKKTNKSVVAHSKEAMSAVPKLPAILSKQGELF